MVVWYIYRDTEQPQEKETLFVFGDFNVHHKDWLTYSGGTDRPGELCYKNVLTQMINFPTRARD